MFQCKYNTVMHRFIVYIIYIYIYIYIYTHTHTYIYVCVCVYTNYDNRTHVCQLQ